MRFHVGSSVVPAMLAGVLAGCVGPPTTPVDDATSPRPCRGVIDADGRASGATIRWRSADEPRSRRSLAAACRTVGPAVYDVPSNVAAATDLIGVATWNVHVGGGDLPAFVNALREGRLTGGVPVADFVILLQEVFRAGADVPPSIPRGASVPDRIEARTPSGERHDIVRTAGALGLGVFYLPSMRNGPDTGPRAEDRGNAILSTRPLSSPAAFELPFVRQRRVALAASIAGRRTDGRPWRLRVVSAHLDASTGPRYLWLLTSAERERQARWLADAVADDPSTPIAIGADLNTWAGGPREPAYLTLRRHLPEPTAPTRATFRFGFTLDYLFFRLPASWSRTTRALTDRFGSDHHPVVAWIRFAREGPSQSPAPGSGADGANRIVFDASY